MPTTTAARHSNAPLRTLACRASAFARACTSHLLAAFLLSSLLLSIPAHSEVALPNGEYREEIEDLRVQVLGGPIRITRDYVFDRWQINARWAPLKFNLDSLDKD